MKPHLDIQHVGTLGDEGRQRMTFDPNSVAHLMSVLTDLYSNRELAVVREYSTNARDSHIEAGKANVPIQIESPTPLHPVLTVRDFGVGMSVDTIYNRFGQYGYSSKRDSDEVNGMLGLGCKAGLTYTSQFTLVARHDGVQATVLITRDEEGAGAIQVVDTCATEEINGVELQIPVSNITKMVSEINKFYEFWDPGTVMVDGKMVESVWTPPEHDNWIRIDPDIIISPTDPTDYLVMGGVAYPVRLDGYTPMNVARWARGVQATNDYNVKGGGVIVRVPIGSVNFVPSREDLATTKRTKETLQEAIDYVKNRLYQWANLDIDGAPDHFEARRRAEKYVNLMGHSRLRYKGELIPHQYAFDTPHKAYVYSAQFQGEKETSTPIQNASFDTVQLYTLIVTGWKGGSHVAPQMRAKARYYARKVADRYGIKKPSPSVRPWQADKILFTDYLPRRHWLDESRMCIVDIEDVRNVELPEADKPVYSRSNAKWRLLHANGNEVEDIRDGVDLDIDRVVAWAEPDDFRGDGSLKVRAVSNCLQRKEMIVQVRAADRKKFDRLVKASGREIPTVRQWLRTLPDTLFKDPDWFWIECYHRDGIVGRAYDEHDRWHRVKRNLRCLRKNELHLIQDPELRELAELLQGKGNRGLDDVNRLDALQNVWNAVSGRVKSSSWDDQGLPRGTLSVVMPLRELPRDKAMRQWVGKMVNAYPLLREVNLNDAGNHHLLEYINSVYLTRVIAGHPALAY